MFCRARKMKERLGLSELRKAANRMNFGEVSLIMSNKLRSMKSVICFTIYIYLDEIPVTL